MVGNRYTVVTAAVSIIHTHTRKHIRMRALTEKDKHLKGNKYTEE